MPAEYTAEDLEAGRTALLSGWSAGTEPSLVITRTSGALAWDEEGREYIDCTSMAWSNNLGGSRPEVIEAAFAQARELSHLRSNFDSVPLLLLSQAMTRAAPGDLKRIGFTLHGSLAVEMAMKLALINRPHSTGPFLALADAYHGRSLASMGLGWPHTNHAFDRVFPAVLRVPQPYAYRSGRSADAEVDYCVGELRDAITRRATGVPPAFFMEPVQGNGSQLDFPERYYREVRQVCDEHGILLIFDEVQTGFGRTGKMWAAEHYGVTPDLLVFGKGVGGGFPLAGVLASSALDGFQPGDDALTFGEFPPSLAAGLAALEVLERDNLLQACYRAGQVRDRRAAGDAAAAPADRRRPRARPADRHRAGPRPADQGARRGRGRRGGAAGQGPRRAPRHDQVRGPGQRPEDQAAVHHHHGPDRPGPGRARPGPDRRRGPEF